VDEAPHKPQALDYATPAGTKKSPLATKGISLAMVPVAGLFGIVAGLFGSLMLFYGFEGVLWLIADWKKVDAQDIFSVALFIVIGAICAWFSFRWLRSAFRGHGAVAGR
jgi:hypothetical protein